MLGVKSQIIFGLATGFAPNYILHIIFRAIVAGTCSLMCMGALILTDITSGNIRLYVISIFELFWSIGVIILAIIGSPWQNWRIVYVVISLPTILILFLHPLIPDSPQWLLKKGRVHEVVNILIDAARLNKKMNVVESEIRIELNNLSTFFNSEPKQPSVRAIWKGNFRHKLNLAIVHGSFTIYLSLYLASLVQVRALGNEHLEMSTVLVALSEVFGIFIALFLTLKTSRKWIYAAILNGSASTIGLLANLFSFQSYSSLEKMDLYLLTLLPVKAFISTLVVLHILFASELVEKKMRKTCNFSIVTCARTFGITAPFIGYYLSFGSPLISQNIIHVLNIFTSLLIALFIHNPKTNLEDGLKNEFEVEKLNKP